MDPRLRGDDELGCWDDEDGVGMTNPALICVGAVMGGHGVHGSVLVKSFTQDPATFTTYPVLYNQTGDPDFKIVSAKIHKGPVIIVRFENIKGRFEADQMKGTLLYVPRTVLPDLEGEEYYHADLLGLLLRLGSGEDFGKVIAVHNFGAGDILEVKCIADGKQVMVPFTWEAIPEIRVSEGYIVINPEFALPGYKPDGKGG